MIYVGIDNGLTGAVVALTDEGTMMTWFDTPTIKGDNGRMQYEPYEMYSELDSVCYQSITTVFIEKSQPMYKDGSKQAYSTGYGFGLWEGILCSIGVNYIVVPPKRWQKKMFKYAGDGTTKEKSFERCQILFPDLPLMRPRGRTLQMHGRSDAALIAYYGYLTHGRR